MADIDRQQIRLATFLLLDRDDHVAVLAGGAAALAQVARLTEERDTYLNTLAALVDARHPVSGTVEETPT